MTTLTAIAPSSSRKTIVDTAVPTSDVSRILAGEKEGNHEPIILAKALLSTPRIASVSRSPSADASGVAILSTAKSAVSATRNRE